MELTVNVKVTVLLGTTDLQGKAYVVNMTQHNGESGCVTCEETGVVVTQGKGHTRCYPYRSPMERAPKRTTETLLENALQANERQKKVLFNEHENAILSIYSLASLIELTNIIIYACFSGCRNGGCYQLSPNALV